MGDTFVCVKEITTGYGRKEILRSVSLEFRLSRITAILGHNGSGKSTLLKAIFGILPVWSGEIWVSDQLLILPSPAALLRLGAAYVPQGQRVFSHLTVLEHLELGGITLRSRIIVKARIQEVLDLFPVLRLRANVPAGMLSGGEKKWLALATALMVNPRLILLDEPSAGLSEAASEILFQSLKAINYSNGITIAIVEQKIRKVLEIADDAVVLRSGRLTFSGQSAHLISDEKRLQMAFL